MPYRAGGMLWTALNVLRDSLSRTFVAENICNNMQCLKVD